MDNKRLLELLQQISDYGPMHGPYFLPNSIKLQGDEMFVLMPYLQTDNFWGVTFATGLNEHGKATLADLRAHSGVLN